METLYSRIAEDLSRQIIGGELKPGDMIPSEAQLSLQYGASKMTVRQGLARLYEAGYIVRVPGKGNFVATPLYDVFTMHFNEKMITGGYTDGIRILEVLIINPDEEVKNNLGIKQQSARVVMLKRLLSNREGPAAFDIKYIPYDRGKPVVEKEMGEIPFPEMIADHGQLFSAKNEVRIYAAAADEDIALRLKVALNSPLLVVEQRLFYEDRVIGWGKTCCRPDAFQLQAISSQYIKSKSVWKS